MYSIGEQAGIADSLRFISAHPNVELRERL